MARIQKYVEVAQRCTWTPPPENRYTEDSILDAALHVTLNNEIQMSALYIVMGWIPMLQTCFKRQLKNYISRYGSPDEHQAMLRIRGR